MDRDTTPEWVCPRHMPIGTQATLDMSEHPGAVEILQPMASDVCPTCRDGSPTNTNQRGIFNTWVCSKCNYRWGTLAEPLGNHTDDWYWETMLELRAHMQGTGLPIRRIEVTPQVWALFYRMHESEVIGGPYGIRSLWGVPIHVNTGPDSPHSVLIHTEDVGRTTALPVSRLGGAPGRPQPSTHNSLLELIRGPQEALREDVEHGRRTLQDLLPARPGVVYTANPPNLRHAPAPPSQPASEPPEVDGDVLGIPVCGSLWVNRASGDLVEVVARPSSSQGTEAIVFRRASSSEDIPEPQNTMIYADFINLHRAWSAGEITEPYVLPIPGDEWEHVTDKTTIEIITLDIAREIAHVVERKVKRRRSIPLREFGTGNWRKIVRRTLFEHLMDDEL